MKDALQDIIRAASSPFDKALLRSTYDRFLVRMDWQLKIAENRKTGTYLKLQSDYATRRGFAHILMVMKTYKEKFGIEADVQEDVPQLPTARTFRPFEKMALAEFRANLEKLRQMDANLVQSPRVAQAMRLILNYPTKGNYYYALDSIRAARSTLKAELAAAAAAGSQPQTA